MSGGQACRQIEESAWEAGPPAVPELDEQSPVPESATRRRRSAAETMPTSESDPQTAAPAGRADWCVDMGDVMLAMTTFELWEAVERCEVSPWVRVWREGLECWTPVGELAELRWAVSSLPPPPEPMPSEAMIEPTPADATTGPIEQPATTPAPTSQPIAAHPPARAVSRQASRGSLPEATPAPETQASPSLPSWAHSTRWMLAGAAVATLAIGMAVVRVSARPAIAPSEPAPRALAAAPGAAVAREAPAAEPSPIEESPALTPYFAEPSERATTPAVRREERGQRRLPRGGRRAQGR